MLTTRILTGAVLGVAVVLASLYGTTAIAAGVIGLLWVIGAAEWSRLARLSSPAAGVFVVLIVGLMAGFAWRGFGSMAATAGIWWGVAAIALALIAMWRFPRAFPRPLILFAGLVCLVPSWLALARLHSFDPGLALAGIVIIWGADVGAYAGGRAFGRHKLAPRISPGKTWEGVAGGLLVAMLVALAAVRLLDLPAAFVVLAAGAAAVSVLGDLNVSMLKRTAGLKDSGRLLPGHGGALDRIDGLTTGLPFIAIGLQLALLVD